MTLRGNPGTDNPKLSGYDRPAAGEPAETSAALLIGSVLFRRRKWLLAAWVLLAALFAAIAWLLPKEYTSSATFQVNTSNSFKFSLPEGLKMLDPKFNSGGSGTGSVLAILESRRLAVEMIERFNLKKKYRTKWEHLAIKQFRKNFAYEVFDEGIVEASFSHGSQDTVKMVLDSIISYVNRESIKYSTSKAKLEFEFNRNLVDSVYQHLDSLSREWIEFMNRNKMADFEKNVELSLKSYGKLEESLVQLESENLLAKIDNSKSPQERENIKATIALLRRKQQDLLKGKRAQDKDSRGFELAVNYDSIPTMSAYMEKINLFVEKDKIVLRALLPKLEDSRIKMVENTPVLNILDPSFVPPYKSGPKRAIIILIGTFVAGCFVTGLLIVWDALLNPSFRSRAIDDLIMHVRRHG